MEARRSQTIRCTPRQGRWVLKRVGQPEGEYKTQLCTTVKGAESFLASGKVAGSEWLAGSVHPDLPSGSWGSEPQIDSNWTAGDRRRYRTFQCGTDRDKEGDMFTLHGEVLCCPIPASPCSLTTEHTAGANPHMQGPLGPKYDIPPRDPSSMAPAPPFTAPHAFLQCPN